MRTVNPCGCTHTHTHTDNQLIVNNKETINRYSLIFIFKNIRAVKLII